MLNYHEDERFRLLPLIRPQMCLIPYRITSSLNPITISTCQSTAIFRLSVSTPAHDGPAPGLVSSIPAL